MKIKQITTAHPVPWRYVGQPNGVIVVIDGLGQQVQLLTMLDFVVAVTANMGAPVPETVV